jgi:hypothetical protein
MDLKEADIKEGTGFTGSRVGFQWRALMDTKNILIP